MMLLSNKLPIEQEGHGIEVDTPIPTSSPKGIYPAAQLHWEILWMICCQWSKLLLHLDLLLWTYDIQSYHIHVSSSLSRIDFVTFWIFRLNGLLCCHGQPISWFYIRNLSHRGHCTTCVAILKNTNIGPIEASGPQCSNESRKFWRENIYMHCNIYHPILFFRNVSPN